MSAFEIVRLVLEKLVEWGPTGVARSAWNRLKRCVRPAGDVSLPWHVERNQEYDRQLFDIMRLVLQPTSTCIDIGANCGDIVGRMFAYAPQGNHHAVEPIPELAAQVKATYPQARVHACALSDRPGQSTFFQVVNNTGESSLRRIHGHTIAPEYKEIVVPLHTLDDLIPDQDHICLIKLDTEGSEPLVMRGGRKTIQRCKPLIIFELGGDSGGDKKGTTAQWGFQPEEVYGIIVQELGMKVQPMGDWLRGAEPWSFDRFLANWRDPRGHFYLLAHW